MKRLTFLAIALLGLTSEVSAAQPPGLLNYQGVLRDSMDIPLNTTVDMVFRFYNTDGGAPPCPSAGGTLLLTDSHLQAGTGGVVVSDGLFNVPVGGGNITPGTETTFSNVFRDHAAVYMEVDVDDGAAKPVPRGPRTGGCFWNGSVQGGRRLRRHSSR